MNSYPPELFLVRHGETEWSRNGRHTGRTELELTETGVAEATAVRPLLAGIHFDLILCSPRRRAQHTADLAGFAGRYEIEPDLSEWDYGDYEGLTSVQIHKQRPDWLIWNDGCPGGESGPQVLARLGRMTERVRHGKAARVLCFGHGHSLRVLTLSWLGLETRQGAMLGLETATVSVLGWEKESPAIRHWNVPGGGLGSRLPAEHRS